MSWGEDVDLEFNRAANDTTPDDKGPQVKNKNKNKKLTYSDFGITGSEGSLSNASKAPPVAPKAFGSRRPGNVSGSNSADLAMVRMNILRNIKPPDSLYNKLT